MENGPKLNEIENQEMKKLEGWFFDVLLKFSTDKEKIKVLFEKLVELYSQEERHYHTLKHIHAMLVFLEKNKNKIRSWESVVCATWYHDSVYEANSKTNEEDSAVLMREDLLSLGVPEDLVESIASLIIDTKKHYPTGSNPDALLFLDADLSILAKPAHIYDTYSANIRKEYAWVPEEEYKKGRVAVLQNFLNREKIYFSPDMDTHEAIARENLAREILLLSQS
jgi:predicted metal-dependent HD superfamily phosphohydrolase